MHAPLPAKVICLKNNRCILCLLWLIFAFGVKANAQTVTSMYTTRHLATRVNHYTNDSLTRTYNKAISIPNSEYAYIYSNKQSLCTLTASPGLIKTTVTDPETNAPSPHIMDYPTAETFFKDLELGSLLLTNTTSKGTAAFGGDLPVFKWKITSEKKTILHHPCKKAVCTYNGTRVIAWYATDIKIKDGPARFHGLPGLILKVRVGDYLETTATCIEISKTNTEIPPPVINVPIKRL